MNGLLGIKFPHATQANDAFMQAAERNGFGITEYPLTGLNGKNLRGLNDEFLATKVTVIGNPDAQHRIWITTGLHGVERLAGTAFCCWLMENREEIEKLLGLHICIIIIDDLVPWGASHYSRFTHEGIDVNRNFRHDFPKKPQLPRWYREVDNDLNPDALTLVSEIGKIRRLFKFQKDKGDEAVQEIARDGQGVDGRKMFFFGSEPTWTNSTLREIIRNYSVNRPGHDVHVDIHSGLGPSIAKSNPLLITIYEPGSDEQRRAQKFFGENIFSTHEQNKYTSSGVGTIENAFFDELPNGRIYTGVCAELGTIDIALVMMGLRWRHCTLNNKNWWHRQPHERWTRYFISMAFFKATNGWRKRVNPCLYEILERVITKLQEEAQ